MLDASDYVEGRVHVLNISEKKSIFVLLIYNFFFDFIYLKYFLILFLDNIHLLKYIS